MPRGPRRRPAQRPPTGRPARSAARAASPRGRRGRLEAALCGTRGIRDASALAVTNRSPARRIVRGVLFDEIVAKVGPQRYRDACERAWESAAGTGRCGGARSFAGDLQTAPAEFADAWWHGDAHARERLQMALRLYSEMPCYANTVALHGFYREFDEAQQARAVGRLPHVARRRGRPPRRSGRPLAVGRLLRGRDHRRGGLAGGRPVRTSRRGSGASRACCRSRGRCPGRSRRRCSTSSRGRRAPSPRGLPGPRGQRLRPSRRSRS